MKTRSSSCVRQIRYPAFVAASAWAAVLLVGQPVRAEKSKQVVIGGAGGPIVKAIVREDGLAITAGTNEKIQVGMTLKVFASLSEAQQNANPGGSAVVVLTGAHMSTARWLGEAPAMAQGTEVWTRLGGNTEPPKKVTLSIEPDGRIDQQEARLLRDRLGALARDAGLEPASFQGTVRLSLTRDARGYSATCLDRKNAPLWQGWSLSELSTAVLIDKLTPWIQVIALEADLGLFSAGEPGRKPGVAVTMPDADLRVGDPMHLELKAPQPSEVFLVSVDPIGVVSRLLPRANEPNNELTPNQLRVFPDPALENAGQSESLYAGEPRGPQRAYALVFPKGKVPAQFRTQWDQISQVTQLRQALRGDNAVVIGGGGGQSGDPALTRLGGSAGAADYRVH